MSMRRMIIERLLAPLRSEAGQLHLSRYGGFVVPGSEGGPESVDPQTLDPSRLERFWQPIYDRVNYPAAGSQTLTFFSTPVGQSATLIRAGTASSVVKTIRDTYLRNAGVMPQTAWFARGIYFVMVPASVAGDNANTDSVLQDLQILVSHGHVEFSTNNKVLLQAALPVMGPWFGTSGGVATTATARRLVSAPFQSEIKMFEVPWAFRPNQPVEASMTFDGSPALTQTWDIYWVFDALITRPT